MKRLFSFSILLVLLASCGQKVPFTDALKTEFNLDEESLSKIQFYTSTVITLERSASNGTQSTGNDGALVVNSSKTQDRIIIPANTKCIFEKISEKNEIVLRFEVGTGKILKFSVRPTQTNGKYYLNANCVNANCTIEYGNEQYTLSSGSSSAYLQVLMRKLQKTKRKDRIVKGMKV